jgi:ADP-heptose:LPS heptosyltransferase
MPVFAHLNIQRPGERVAVGLVDLALAPLTLLGPAPPPRRLERLLVVRLERIGDLLMTLPALDALRRAHPAARITLAVGSWNAELARALPAVDEVEVLDAPWLARERSGASLGRLIRTARSWRHRFDAAINFEPDVRSNLLVGLSGSPCRIGFSSGGGGALLTTALPFDVTAHTTANCLRLVEALPGGEQPPGATGDHAAGDAPGPIGIPADARVRVDELLRAAGFDERVPLLVVHASGGRAIKQWPPSRFGRVADLLARRQGALVVLTGTTTDRALVDEARREVTAGRVLDATGQLELPALAALIERARLVITGDTGPMHLAAALGRPVVAVFGPSDPVRYAPLGTPHRVVRVDLPCSPCNRIRLPPERCRVRTPDCLRLVDVEAVVSSADALLESDA